MEPKKIQYKFALPQAWYDEKSKTIYVARNSALMKQAQEAQVNYQELALEIMAAEGSFPDAMAALLPIMQKR